MRRTISAVALVAVTGSGLVGCFNHHPEGDELRAVTFNVGLAPYDVDYTEERAPHVADAIAGLRADVVCIQELWREDDFEAVREAAAVRFPTALRHAPMPATTSCTQEELGPLAACALTMCDGLSGEELAGCALDRCSAELAALSSGCTSCVVENVGSADDVSDIQAACADPGGGGAGYLYGGSFDTALLTSLPVRASDSRVLDSFSVRASVEYALLDGPGGEVHVFCTHLASEIGAFTYAGDHGDWKGEQRHQIQQLLAMVEDLTGGSGQVLVMGDLNNGPEIARAGIEAKWPEHYDLFGAAGLANPYAAQPGVACTSCPDNSFHEPDSKAKLIDHVLTRGIGARARGRRLFTDLITIEVEGAPLETHLSDHYGLQMSFRY